MTRVIIVSLLSFNLANQHLNLCITWHRGAQSLNTKRPLDLSGTALNLALNRSKSSSEVPISFHVIPPPASHTRNCDYFSAVPEELLLEVLSIVFEEDEFKHSILEVAFTKAIVGC